MKAMILAAGLGKRMRPLTNTLPKPLLEVRGAPLIAHHLQALADAGVREVVINLAYRGEQIRDYVGNGTHWGLRVAYSTEPEPLETGGAILKAEPLLGSEPFLLVNADVFTDLDYAPLTQHELGNSLAHLVMVPNPDFKDRGDFALDGAGRITALPEGQAGVTFAGVSVIDPALVMGYPEKRPRFALVEALRWAMAQDRLTGRLHNGLWSDVGTPERLERLNDR